MANHPPSIGIVTDARKFSSQIHIDVTELPESEAPTENPFEPGRKFLHNSEPSEIHFRSVAPKVFVSLHMSRAVERKVVVHLPSLLLKLCEDSGNAAQHVPRVA